MSNIEESNAEELTKVICPNCKSRIRVIFDHQHHTKTVLRGVYTEEEFVKTFTVKAEYKFKKHE